MDGSDKDSLRRLVHSKNVSWAGDSQETIDIFFLC